MIHFKPNKPLGSITRYFTWAVALLCLFLLSSVRIGADNTGTPPTAPAGTAVSPAQALIWPLDGGFKLTSLFGMRYHPILKEQRMHIGIDLSVKMGTPVRAVADGRILEAGWKGNYGRCIIITHPGGRATLYAMLDRIDVQAGAEVRQGEIIALSGRTGVATGPHLHFEVHVKNQPVDPLSLLPPLKTTP